MKEGADDQILSELQKCGLMTFAQVAEKSKDIVPSGVAYHLKQLQKKKLVVIERDISKLQALGRIDRGNYPKQAYRLVPIMDHPISKRIDLIFKEDEYAIIEYNDLIGKLTKSEKFTDEEVKNYVEKMIKMNILDVAKSTQEHRLVQYPVWRMPNSVCHYCGKEFKDNQLVVSQIVDHEGIALSSYPIHATCRNEIINDSVYDQRQACCNYCGLSLNAKDIVSAKDENNPLVISAMEKLFDEPYSKLFSFLSLGEYETIQTSSSPLRTGLASGERALFWAYSIRKNGKQYHPYCAKQVK